MVKIELLRFPLFGLEIYCSRNRYCKKWDFNHTVLHKNTTVLFKINRRISHYQTCNNKEPRVRVWENHFTGAYLGNIQRLGQRHPGMFIKGNSRLINLKGQAEILKSGDNKPWIGWRTKNKATWKLWLQTRTKKSLGNYSADMLEKQVQDFRKSTYKLGAA